MSHFVDTRNTFDSYVGLSTPAPSTYKLCGGYSRSASLVTFWAQAESYSPAGAKSRLRNHAKQRNLIQVPNQVFEASRARAVR